MDKKREVKQGMEENERRTGAVDMSTMRRLVAQFSMTQKRQRL